MSRNIQNSAFSWTKKPTMKPKINHLSKVKNKIWSYIKSSLFDCMWLICLALLNWFWITPQALLSLFLCATVANTLIFYVKQKLTRSPSRSFFGLNRSDWIMYLEYSKSYKHTVKVVTWIKLSLVSLWSSLTSIKIAQVFLLLASAKF